MTRKTNKQAVLDCLKNYSELTVKDIAEITGINRASVGGTLTALRQDGKVRVTSKTAGARGGVVYNYELSCDPDDARPTRDVVYEALLDNGPAKRREISDMLNINPRVVTTAIKALREDGLVDVIDTTYENGGATYTYRALKKTAGLSAGQMIERIVALGGGPFGLMAAQLGARP